jgi:hypothetical protein
MSVAAANGYPQMGNNSATGIGSIPIKFANKVLVKYYADSHLAQCANTDYEGEIKAFGDEVKIRTRPTITSKAYSKGQTLVHDTPQPGVTSLKIDKGQYYNFLVEAVDEKQHDIVLADEFTDDASLNMRNDIESAALARIALTAHANNQGLTAGLKTAGYNLGVTGTPVALTKTNVIEFLTSLRSVLGEQNADKGKLWVLVPYWVRFLLVNSDLKNASLTGDGKSILRNGRIGEIDGLEIMVSNLMPSYTDGSTKTFDILCGNRDAITWAAQLVNNRSITDKDVFGTFYQGLYVYGHETVKPEGLARGYVYKGT